MTRKKNQSIYGMHRAETPLLHTWHEEPGYEDWILKREQLASIYYQEHSMQDTADPFTRQQTARNYVNERRHTKETQNHVQRNINDKKDKLARKDSVKSRKADRDNKRIKKESKAKAEKSLGELVKGEVSPCEEELSMWSCRKCTLDNPLQTKVCGACGGSRLCSIGDIDIPRIFRCDKVEQMIEEAEEKKSSFIRQRDNETLFETNKRLSKIEDDDKEEAARDDFQITNLIDIKSILALICYVIIFIIIFNY